MQTAHDEVNAGEPGDQPDEKVKEAYHRLQALLKEAHDLAQTTLAPPLVAVELRVLANRLEPPPPARNWREAMLDSILTTVHELVPQVLACQPGRADVKYLAELAEKYNLHLVEFGEIRIKRPTSPRTRRPAGQAGRRSSR
jgi:hypothetical protein